jgi:hypothetical protein
MCHDELMEQKPSTAESPRQRVSRSAGEWRTLIEAQPSSGLGVEPYCRQHGITGSCFYRWRRFFSGATGTSSDLTKKKRRRAPIVGTFATVQVVEDRSEPPSESIRLKIAGGRELMLPASMPAERLADLLVALERGR